MIRRYTLQDGATETGNGDAVNVKGRNSCIFQVSGTFSGTVVFEGKVSGGDTWEALLCTNLSTGADGTTASSSGLFKPKFGIGGLAAIRARISNYSSGEVTVVCGITE